MKKNLQKDFLVYISAKCVSAVIGILPYRITLFLGKLLGLLAFRLSRKKKRISYGNLRSAFCMKLPPAEIKKINRRLFIHLGMMVMEILQFPKLNRKNIEKYVEFQGYEKIDKALTFNKGVILLSAHFGNWELLPVATSIKGYEVVVLAKEQKMPRLNRLLNLYRQEKGCRIVPLGMAVREIIRSLKENKVVGMMADQGADKNSVVVEFLGREVPVPQGVVMFAQKTKAKVLPLFIVRAGLKHKIIVEDELDVSYSGDIEVDTKKALEKFNALLEKYIYRYPEQWVWVYKRWKYSPQRDILLLSDRKPGHLRQSQSIVNLLKSDNMKVETNVVEIQYKNPVLRMFITLCGLLSSRSCQGCMRCLKFGLKGDAFNKLMKSYADVVVSAGASIAAVNRIISQENNAKNVIMMKPSFFPAGLYNLVIMPKHDHPPRGKNIVTTEGAIILLPFEKYRQKLPMLRHRLNITKDRIIGVLIGGDTKKMRITAALVRKVLKDVKAAAIETDAEVLITTSRRTSAVVENIVREEMKDFKWCKMVVISNVNSDREVIPEILVLSDIIIVSGESVSMVSEAAASSAGVIAFRPVRLGFGTTKHEKFLTHLEKKGYIKIVSTDNIKETIFDFWDGTTTTRILNDAEKVKTALMRII
ncbi:MAG: ELM1/GtrOC1 family putative glycosyltransferase [Candidatus Omnitrophota bacterium]